MNELRGIRDIAHRGDKGGYKERDGGLREWRGQHYITRVVNQSIKQTIKHYRATQQGWGQFSDTTCFE